MKLLKETKINDYTYRVFEDLDNSADWDSPYFGVIKLRNCFACHCCSEEEIDSLWGIEESNEHEALEFYMNYYN